MSGPKQKKQEQFKTKGVLSTILGAAGKAAETLIPGAGLLPLEEAGTFAGDALKTAFRPKQEKKQQELLNRIGSRQPKDTVAPIDTGAGARAAAQSFALGPENTQANLKLAKMSQDAGGEALAKQRLQDLRSFYRDKSQMMRDQGRRVEEARRADEKARGGDFKDTVGMLQTEDFEKKLRGMSPGKDLFREGGAGFSILDKYGAE